MTLLFICPPGSAYFLLAGDLSTAREGGYDRWQRSATCRSTRAEAGKP